MQLVTAHSQHKTLLSLCHFREALQLAELVECDYYCRVIIPLLPAALLFVHRGNLNAPKVQLQLGYIYRMYRQAVLTVSYIDNMHVFMRCDVLILTRHMHEDSC